MKIITLMVLLLATIQAESLTQKCEDATNKAVEIHVNYMNNIATLTESYNASDEMKRICNE